MDYFKIENLYNIEGFVFVSLLNILKLCISLQAAFLQLYVNSAIFTTKLPMQRHYHDNSILC